MSINYLNYRLQVKGRANRGPKPPPVMLSTSDARYIKCRRKVMQYPNLKAAQAALPRIRHADPTATLVPSEQEYELLKATPPADVIVQSAR